MWGNKKSHTPQAVDPEPKNCQTNQPPNPAPASWEGTTKIHKDVMGSAGATTDRATACLGLSLHVKGEISGNEDLCIDGTVEGLVHLDEQKLTVGATAKLTGDVIAGEVIVYGTVKGNVHGKGKTPRDEKNSETIAENRKGDPASLAIERISDDLLVAILLV
jgi:hypothetical protein